MKLKDFINSKQKPLGSTPEGQDWCLKALHPADPIVEVRGIPDKSAFPSVFMNYQATFTLSAPAGSAGTWSFDMQMMPHPVHLLSYIGAASGGAFSGSFLNSQLDGATPYAKWKTFKSLARRWRLAYMSTTVYQDAPDLANQGTLVVCQKPVAFDTYGVSGVVVDNTAALPIEGTILGSSGVQKGISYNAADFPDFDVSQTMPNAYFGRSREGAYIPLKLTKTCQQWQSRADAIRIFDDAQAWESANSGQQNTIGASAIPYVAGAVSNYPFYGVSTLSHEVGTANGYNNGVILGQDYAAPLSDVWADISAKNLAVTTSYSFFVRMGIEMQVVPGSILTPHQKLSPMYDGQALKAYFAISRELKDAYPADHNDLGKIWDAISKAITWISPALNFIPEVGPVLSGGVKAVQSIGDTIREKTRKKQVPAITPPNTVAEHRDLPSAAEVQHALDQRNLNRVLERNIIAPRPQRPFVRSRAPLRVKQRSRNRPLVRFPRRS